MPLVASLVELWQCYAYVKQRILLSVVGWHLSAASRAPYGHLQSQSQKISHLDDVLISILQLAMFLQFSLEETHFLSWNSMTIVFEPLFCLFVLELLLCRQLAVWWALECDDCILYRMCHEYDTKLHLTVHRTVCK